MRKQFRTIPAKRTKWIFNVNLNKCGFKTGVGFKSKIFVKIHGKKYWISHFYQMGKSIAWHFTNGKITFSYDLKQHFGDITDYLKK